MTVKPAAAALAIGASLACATPAAARCTGSTPIEKAICGDPALAAADRTLNATYAGVRAKLAASAATELLVQQRAWLKRRNAACAKGRPACGDSYRRRNDELTALAATADAADEPLADATPIVLRGRWTAGRIEDPAAPAPADPAAVRGALVDTGLPPPGTVIAAAPARLCIDGRPCQPFGWRATTLAKVDGGPSIATRFGLAATQRAWIGSAGGPRSYILLLPRGTNALGAVFTLCKQTGVACRNAVQWWTPASPDAAISPRG